MLLSSLLLLTLLLLLFINLFIYLFIVLVVIVLVPVIVICLGIVVDRRYRYYLTLDSIVRGARCSSAVRAFAHGAMGRRIDPSWGGPIELFLVPASAPRLV